MKLRTQLLLVYVIVFFFMVVIVAVMYQSSISLRESGSWVAHTHEVIAHGNYLEKLLIDMETGVRGFLITGKESFLEPYKDGTKKYVEELAQLKNLTSDNPVQIKRLEEIDTTVKEWQKNSASPEIAARIKMDKTGSSIETVSALIQKGTGKAIMDILRVKLDDFTRAEEKLLVIRIEESESSAERIIYIAIFGSILTIVIGILAMLFITRRVAIPIKNMTDWSLKIAEGDLSYVEIKTPSNEIGILNDSFGKAVMALQEAESERKRNSWLITGQSQLNDQMRGEQTVDELCNNIITCIANYLDIQVGTLYVKKGSEAFKLMASYAYKIRKNLSSEFKMGEGLIGQSALEKRTIVLTNVPDDYITVTSGLGEKTPKHIIVIPFMHNETVVGILEIGSLYEFTELQIAFLEAVSNGIAIAVTAALSRVELQDMLEKTQKQAEELESQQGELRAANEELEEQTQKLQVSEEQLKAQQEELQVTNEELEEKSNALEEQREEVMQKNRELESVQADLQQQAKSLELASKYKSEFLSNMSHELRTPLNSLLILAQDLATNKKNNLDESQIESANIIESSGKTLLNLINDILDLSKIEAGRMDINIERIRISEITQSIQMSFKPLTDDKGLELSISATKDMPEIISTDRQRLEQIIRNLVSNAVKFTNKGSVSVEFHKPAPEVKLFMSGLEPQNAFAVSVSDTGIGIAEEKKAEIFEAFMQADGSTSRVYGGTGLGLSISRELAKLLGGEIQLVSKMEEGSTFTIYLPCELKEWEKTTPEAIDRNIEKIETPAIPISTSEIQHIPDDRDIIGDGDRTILVIEDDLKFAKVLSGFCHDREFKCLHAGDGESGLELADKFKPDAIILDIRLPGIDGWGVLENLKNNTKTRHIPVHMVSVEEESIDAYKKGAIGYLTKPVDQNELQEAFDTIKDVIERDIKNLLVIEDDKVMRRSIIKLIGNGDVRTQAVGTGKEALKELQTGSYDCVILDLKLPDMSGFEVLKRLDESEGIEIPPVIVYTGKNLTHEEEYQLREYASSIILKGVKSQERLLDETALFLHRIVDNLPAGKRKMISRLHEGDALFNDKKILLVDDDMRNVFSISKVLEERGIDVYKASDGQQALDILTKESDIDLVLMDIMMPVMDGYTAIREIRNPQSGIERHDVPIIALTAKAMKEDRDKCISAGANDYLPKPLDIERLLSLLRVWLYK